MTSTPLFDGASLPGLTAEERAELALLWAQYREKLPGNQVLQSYYDTKNLMQNMRIAIPPEYEGWNWALGWPAKAVDVPAARIRHDGFTVSGDRDTFGITADWEANRMHLGVRSIVTSALLHSCAFVAAVPGDTASGEPEIVYAIGSATNATGLYDARRRRLRSALFLNETGDYGAVLDIALFFPGRTIHARRETLGAPWQVRPIPNLLAPEVPVELVPFDERLERPFGRSRITPTVRSLTDSALRTVARSELGAEFFSNPQRYLMGADSEMFRDEDGQLMPEWQAVIGRILAAPPVEDAEGRIHVPQAGQFNAQDPRAHADLLRMFAMQLSGETSIPLEKLGVSMDSNPASAEAINAVNEDLVLLSEAAADTIGDALDRLVVKGWRLRNKGAAAPKELLANRSRFRPAQTITRQAQADAAMKTFAAVPWLAHTRVGLEQLGWSADDIDRALAERDAAEARLKASQPDPAPAVSVSADESVE